VLHDKQASYTDLDFSDVIERFTIEKETESNICIAVQKTQIQRCTTKLDTKMRGTEDVDDDVNIE
jgi:hypothetical protein